MAYPTTVVTPALLVAVGCQPLLARELAEPFAAACARADIDSRTGTCMLLAQLAHESANFTARAENLNYAASALPKVFSAFNATTAQKYGRTADHPADQQAIANIAYGNRLGNGPPITGDGWRFRGRGYIQLTGRALYTAWADTEGIGLDVAVTLAETVPGAISASIWYWRQRGCIAPAFKGDVEAVTRLVNGPAMLGLAERRAKYQAALRVASASLPPAMA